MWVPPVPGWGASGTLEHVQQRAGLGRLRGGPGPCLPVPALRPAPVGCSWACLGGSARLEGPPPSPATARGPPLAPLPARPALSSGLPLSPGELSCPAREHCWFPLGVLGWRVGLAPAAPAPAPEGWAGLPQSCPRWGRRLGCQGSVGGRWVGRGSEASGGAGCPGLECLLLLPSHPLDEPGPGVARGRRLHRHPTQGWLVPRRGLSAQAPHPRPARGRDSF